MLKIQHRVLSEPAEVWWAGFRSDTYRLQQEGWEIAAEEDVAYDRVRLLLRHRDMRLYALTNDVTYRYKLQSDPRMSVSAPPLVFNVVMASPNFQIQRVNLPTFENFNQIDAKPQFVTQEIKSLDDFKIFATPLARTEEIIVEPQTVAAMLDQIRKMQAPEQARIRAMEARAASREGMRAEDQPRQRFHAQILSIENYRKAA